MTTTTWDPGNTDSHVILSGSNLIAANDYPSTNGAWGISRSTTTKASSKFMIEFTLSPNTWVSLGGDPPMGIGVGVSGQVLNNYAGSSANSVGYFLNSGKTYINGSNTSTNLISGWTSGDVGDIAIDFDNTKFWVRRNGAGWFGAVLGSQNPATNTGGVSFSTVAAGAKYAMVTANDGGGINLSGSLTFDFSNTPTYSLPAGFDMWDPLPTGTPARLSPMSIT